MIKIPLTLNYRLIPFTLICVVVTAFVGCRSAAIVSNKIGKQQIRVLNELKDEIMNYTALKMVLPELILALVADLPTCFTKS